MTTILPLATDLSVYGSSTRTSSQQAGRLIVSQKHRVVFRNVGGDQIANSRIAAPWRVSRGLLWSRAAYLVIMIIGIARSSTEYKNANDATGQGQAVSDRSLLTRFMHLDDFRALVKYTSLCIPSLTLYKDFLKENLS